MTENIKGLLSSSIDATLIEYLLAHYQELKHKFFLGQYEPSELNCGKFIEVAIRVLEYIAKRSYTPFGKDISLDALTKELEQMPKDKFSDSIRIHIPRILRAVYDIRSKRGVAHKGEINPNLMDATFVVSACDWIMAELVRLYHLGDPNETQKIIESIVERKVPVIEEFDEDLKVLNPNLSVPDKILLILYRRHPNYVSTDNLKKWIETKSSGYIPTCLSRLDSDAMTHRRGNENIITRRGIEYIERKRYDQIN